MTNNKEEAWIPTSENLDDLKEDLASSIKNDFDQMLIKKKQEETLENLKKYNKERNTEIIDDRNMASVEEVAELQNEVSSMLAANEQKERSRELIEARQEEIEHLHLTKDDPNEWGEPDPNRPRPNRFVPHICEFCGAVAYANQIHGMGYCKERTQYEQ